MQIAWYTASLAAVVVSFNKTSNRLSTPLSSLLKTPDLLLHILHSENAFLPQEVPFHVRPILSRRLTCFDLAIVSRAKCLASTTPFQKRAKCPPKRR